jgi:hypothetical protein
MRIMHQLLSLLALKIAQMDGHVHADAKAVAAISRRAKLRISRSTHPSAQSPGCYTFAKS